jgi:hypothetical protein
MYPGSQPKLTSGVIDSNWTDNHWALLNPPIYLLIKLSSLRMTATRPINASQFFGKESWSLVDSDIRDDTRLTGQDNGLS